MTSNPAIAKSQYLQSPEFEKNLDRLAEVAVRVGLGLAPGQELVMTRTLDAVPLARRITEHAYKAGARSSPRFSPTKSPRCCAFATRRCQL